MQPHKAIRGDTRRDRLANKRFTALLRAQASPPSLVALAAFADGQEVSLQPPFEIARGFGSLAMRSWITRIPLNLFDVAFMRH